MAKVIFDTIIWNNVHEGQIDPESTPKKEIHKILVMGELHDAQAYFAWEYFKYARWVRAEWKATISDTPILDAEDTPLSNEDEDDTQKGEDIEVYHVHVTYPSAEEQYDEDRYGFDYDDY